jgi:anti-anti-sigma factor
MNDDEYTATVNDGVLVVAGEIDEAAGPVFRQDLATHSADFTRDLTVDLSDIEFFPSSAVAIAAIALETARVHGSTVELVAREGSVAQRVLHICELPYRS